MPETEMEPAAQERLFEAALTQLQERGREAMSSVDLAAAAGIDEAELAGAYPDLDGCLTEAYERLAIRLDAAVRVGCSTGGGFPRRSELPWPVRVRGGLEALLVELADRPELAGALTLTYPALGPARQERYQRFLESFGPLLRTRWEMSGLEAELPGEVEMLAVGAAEAIVVEEIRAGRAAGLVTIGPEILFSILVPYLGPAAAAEEMEAARESAQEDGSL